MNPRIFAAGVAVLVLALVMWLGAQTPARTASTTAVSVMTTTEGELPDETVEAVPVVTGRVVSNVQRAARSAAMVDYGQSFYVLMAGQVDGSYLGQFGRGGYGSRRFECGGLPVAMLAAHVGDDLVGVGAASACRYASNSRGEIVGTYANLEELQADITNATLSWFCDRGSANRWLSESEYDLLRQGVGPEHRCEPAEPSFLAVPEGSRVLVSPGEQYALLLPSVGTLGQPTSFIPKLLDLASDENYELEFSGDESFGPWISDEEFIVLTTPSRDPRFFTSSFNRLPKTLSVSIESAVDGERALMLNFSDWDILPGVQVVMLGDSDG